MEGNTKSTLVTQAKGLSHSSKVSQDGENVIKNFTTGKIHSKRHQDGMDY